MKTTLATLLCLILAGCSIRLSRPPRVGLLAAPKPSPECVDLSDKVMGLNITNIIAGGAASGASTGAGIFSSNEVARDCLAGSAALFGLLSAVTGYLSSFYASRYTKQCP